jgi:hypothetical protein
MSLEGGGDIKKRSKIILRRKSGEKGPNIYIGEGLKAERLRDKQIWHFMRREKCNFQRENMVFGPVCRPLPLI